MVEEMEIEKVKPTYSMFGPRPTNSLPADPSSINSTSTATKSKPKKKVEKKLPYSESKAKGLAPFVESRKTRSGGDRATRMKSVELNIIEPKSNKPSSSSTSTSLRSVRSSTRAPGSTNTKSGLSSTEPITLGSSSEDELMLKPSTSTANKTKQPLSLNDVLGKPKKKETKTNSFSIFETKKVKAIERDDPPAKKVKLNKIKPDWVAGMMGGASQKKETRIGVNPLWPDEEEQGYHPSFQAVKLNPGVILRETEGERWQNQAKLKEKGKCKAEVDGTGQTLWNEYSNILHSSMRDLPVPQLNITHVQHPLSKIASLLPNLPQHPLLFRLSRSFLQSVPSISDFKRPHDRENHSDDLLQECDWKDLWTAKYAPQCALEVLGKKSGESAVILKGWLEELAVWSAQEIKLDIRKRKRAVIRTKDKSKRRKNGLEGEDWIINSDEEEEDHGIYDFNSDEDIIESRAKRELFPTLNNLILLVGGVGTGKSCSVFSLAQEMGWDVHEVYPGIGKRGAKDILDLVGNVGRNHTVRGQKQDLFSKRILEVEVLSATREVKQSLILFEEVDVLYKQDKEFWPGLIDLVSKSRRPIIMTCNDISLIPFDNLPLQKVNGDSFLYFSSPEPSIVIPYLQLIALKEGHIIPLESITNLYQSSTQIPIIRKSQNEILPLPLLFKPAEGLDLRKVMNQLQFECQWAIGDKFGGIGWLDTSIGKETRTSWSNGAFVRDSPIQCEYSQTDGVEDIEDAVKRVEMISFGDSFLSRRREVLDEIEEPDARVAEIEGEITLPILSIPIRDRLQLSSSALDSNIHSTFFSLIKSPPSESTIQYDQSRIDFITLARRIIYEEDLLEEPAPQLPHRSIFEDYLPCIRQITKMEDYFSFLDGGDSNTGVKGKGRSTRSRAGAVERRFNWESELKEKVLGSYFEDV